MIVLAIGLVSIAREFFAAGGEALYIDEVHKYPDWSIEIKNTLVDCNFKWTHSQHR